MSRRLAPRLVLGMLLLAALACNPVPNINIPVVSTLQAAATDFATVTGPLISAEATFAAATPIPTAVVPAESLLPARLKAGDLKLSGVTIDSNGADFYGPILQVQVTNPRTQAVLTTIPCGLIFEPDTKTEQRLMVVQPVSTVVVSQAGAALNPYVICIDDSKHAPANASTYQIGSMATGDLLKLAACVCTQTLTVSADLNQEFGLQVAVWHTSDPIFPGDLTNNPLGPALKPLMPLFLSAANGWLTKCGLKTIS
jgi:hypothetical protein